MDASGSIAVTPPGEIIRLRVIGPRGRGAAQYSSGFSGTAAGPPRSGEPAG
jgi:hypothetical protein